MLIDIGKTVIAQILHVLLRGMFVFPLKSNRVVFVPGNGHYYCNLKYVDEEIRREGLTPEVVWIAKGMPDHSYPSGVHRISRRSFSFLYYFFTAKVILFNDGIPSWLIKRKGQVWINTWHGGGAYKRVAALFCDNPNRWQKIRRYHILNQIDYMVSACRKFTEGCEKDVCIPAEYLPIGMPRNDMFFHKDQVTEKSDMVRKYYHVSEDVGIVLYAPTFRENGIKLDMDVGELLASLEKRFHKKFVLFARSHPHVAKDIFDGAKHEEYVLDVSDYADMQELLCAADVLITDYSSSIWDFSFTGRPCFIYANDLASYKEERNFYTPIEEWPFPLAENNAELQKCIIEFDKNFYVKAIQRHQAALGSYENGEASRKLCQLLMDICGRERNR